MRGLCEGERFRGDPGNKATPSETIQPRRRSMSRKKKPATNAGAPVVVNQNIMTAGKRKLYKTKADTKGEQR